MTENDNHERWSELLGPHLRGRLDAADAAALDEHLKGCSECRRELAGLKLLALPEPGGLSRGERKRLHRGVEEATSRAKVPAGAPVPWFARLAPAMGAAALVVMIVAGGILITSNGAEDDTVGDAETVPLDDSGSGVGLDYSDEGTEDSDGGGTRGAKKGDRSVEALEAAPRNGDRAENKKDTATFAPVGGGGGEEADGGQTTSTAGGDKDSKGDDQDGSGEPEAQPPGESDPPTQGAAPSAAEITIEPSSGSATVGGCSAFTITVSNQKGNPVEGIVVDLEQRHELADDGIDSNEPVVSFCLPASGSNATDVDEAAGDLDPEEEQPDNPGTSGGETFATTNSNGRVTIGLDVQPANGSDGSGSVSLVAFVDSSGDDDDPGDGDPAAYATQQWSASEDSRIRALPWGRIRRLTLP